MPPKWEEYDNQEDWTRYQHLVAPAIEPVEDVDEENTSAEPE